MQQQFLHFGKSAMSYLCCKWNISIKQWGATRKFFKQKLVFLNPLQIHLIHFPFSRKRWTSTIIARLELSEQFYCAQTWRHNTKLHEKSQREKWNSLAFSRADFRMVWKCRLFIFIYCLEPTVKKNTWMKTIFVTAMVIFFKLSFWKLLNHSYGPSPFSTVMRHIDDNFWKTPCSWRFYEHVSTYVLILSWLKIMKRKPTKLLGKLLAAEKS